MGQILSEEEFGTKLDAKKSAICDKIVHRFDDPVEALITYYMRFITVPFVVEAFMKHIEDITAIEKIMGEDCRLKLEESAAEWTIKEQNVCLSRWMHGTHKLLAAFPEVIQEVLQRIMSRVS